MTAILVAVEILASVCLVIASPQNPTYSEDVAAILFENCAECHRPEQAAPFSLLTYADAKRRARMIVDTTQDRYMPPWHPTEGFGEFRGERRLTESQIDLLEKWVEAGTPQGDPAKAPKAPTFESGWRLGEPDLVLKMDRPFEVHASGSDIYRWFSLPVNLPKDKWIRGIEVRPSAHSVVHHILFFADERRLGAERESKRGQPGFQGGIRSRKGLGGWAVGSSPYLYPDGYAMKLPKGSDLVLQTHFHPSGKIEHEQTTIGIHFAESPPEQELLEFQAPPNFGARYGLRIGAGEANYVMEDHLVLSEDTTLISAWGHAHQICTSMDAKATLPDGSKVPLIRIAEWDFNWQGQYLYKEPVRLPKGTRIDVRITYDNSAENPNNPYDPPRVVRWGEESNDEMGSIIFNGIATDPKRANALASGIRLEGLKSGKRSRDRMVVNMAMRLDRNGDNRLSLQEVPARKRASFPQADTDKDGLLSPAELQAVARFLEE